MYEEFKMKWLHYYLYNKAWCRQGQAIMNTLEEYGYGLYLQITGTENDCYYDDNKVAVVIEKAKEWFGDE